MEKPVFWEYQKPTSKNKTRPLSYIPDTGWKTPTDYPNLSAAKVISIDVEAYDPELTTKGAGWSRGKSHIVGFSIGTEDGYRKYFPLRHTVEPEYNLDPHKTLRWLHDVLSNRFQPKVGANLIYDVGALRAEGVIVQGTLIDTQSAEALLSESSKVALEIMGNKYLGEGKVSNLLYQWAADSYGGTDADQRANIYRCPPRLVGPYAESDVDLPIRIYERQYPLLVQEGLFDVFRMECDLIYLLIDMRFDGVRVDVEGAEKLRDKLQIKFDKQYAELIRTVGFDVNLNATASKQEVFDKFKIPYGTTEKGNASITKDYMETLKHPVAKMIVDCGETLKLKKDFIESAILNSHVDGIIHAEFHLLRSDKDGARSGRMSGSNPNLQQIPVRSEEGKLIRSLFVPDYGHKQWRKDDQSQIEYRILAHFARGSGANELRAAYVADPFIDYHSKLQETIHEITGIFLERIRVKTCNFGILYGMGIALLMEKLGITKKAAKELLDAYFKGAAFVKETMKYYTNLAEQTGEITTILGRKSRFDLWEPQQHDYKGTPANLSVASTKWIDIKRAYGYRGLNRLIQGTAADIFKKGILDCYKAGIFNELGNPKLFVHDETDFSDMGGKDHVFKEMINIMENTVKLKVPVIIDTELGPNWGDLTEVERSI